MDTVKKNQLAQSLAEKMGASKKDGVMWLEAFIEVVTNHMRKGDKVNLGRNPRTGEAIHIPASKKMRFTPAKVLKEAVK